MSRLIDRSPARRWSARGLRTALAAVVGLGCASPAGAQDEVHTSLYRLFLKDGTPIVSFGEFARAGDRVAFTLPIGVASDPDSLQLVSLPADAIDWERTTRYADTIRYRRYAATSGENDYKALTGDVARGLTDIAFAKEPVKRLAIAQDVRRRLVEWPASHFGYRAGDVRDLTAIVEETISEIRAGAGERQFEISLVAMIDPPADTPLPDPTLRESIELSATVARVSDATSERMSLQQAILSALDQHRRELPESWLKSTRKRLRNDIESEYRDDGRYDELVSQATADAAARAARADVAGVERVMAEARARDAKLGRLRPGQMKSLMTTLEAHVESARALRLAQDRWQTRVETYRAYRREVDEQLSRLHDVRKDIEAVRAMSGPDPKRLGKTEKKTSDIRLVVSNLTPPSDLRGSHDALVSAVQLMREALHLRRNAALSGDLGNARNASAAAAGSLLLLGRARDGIDEFFRAPRRP